MVRYILYALKLVEEVLALLQGSKQTRRRQGRTGLVGSDGEGLHMRVGALQAAREPNGTLTVDARAYHLDGVRGIVQIDHASHQLTEVHLALHRTHTQALLADCERETFILTVVFLLCKHPNHVLEILGSDCSSSDSLTDQNQGLGTPPWSGMGENMRKLYGFSR